MSWRSHSLLLLGSFSILFFSSNDSAKGASLTPANIIVNNEVIGTLRGESYFNQSSKNDEIEVFFSTNFISNGSSITIDELASKYGIHYFNWLQMITEDTNPLFDINKNRLTVPYIDAPSGGYYRDPRTPTYWRDDIPWYLDEKVDPNLIGCRRQPCSTALQKNTFEFTLRLFDNPTDPIPGTRLSFSTFLIADFGNKTYDTLGGFSWNVEILRDKTKDDPFTDLNQNGDWDKGEPYTDVDVDGDWTPGTTTKITDLIPGAVFTGKYARKVQKDFGYTKVLRLPTYKFEDSLSPGEVDSFTLPGLEAGKPFLAWTDNLPGVNPRYKPDTVLGTFNSPIDRRPRNVNNNGGPFASNLGSGLVDFVPANGSMGHDGKLSGNINLKVTGYPDFNFDGYSDFKNIPHCKTGNYKLFVKLYEDSFPGGVSAVPYGSDCPSSPPPVTCSGSSGGGGCTTPPRTIGQTQQNPLLPTTITNQGWKVFRNVPKRLWYDPHTTYGFEFEALEDNLFTGILDFPVGNDDLFTVSVGDTLLGEFGSGESVDFVALLGHGVSHFKITDIDSPDGSTAATAFPILLDFDREIVSFQMRPIAEPETPTPQQVPEPGSALGLLVLGAFSGLQKLRNRLTK